MDLFDVTTKFNDLEPIFKSNNVAENVEQYILVKVLCSLENFYPVQAKNILEIILCKNSNKENDFTFPSVEEVSKHIRQTSDYKEDNLFRDILNTSFGEKIIKTLRCIDRSNKELFGK